MKLLVVDGYNVINKIPYLSKIADQNLQEARRAITQLANEYKRKDGGISEVYVVFDGKNQYKNLDLPTPKEHIFSATGEGDRKIIETVKEVSDKGVVIVVSDDNYVRNNARAYSASLLHSRELIKN